MDERDWLTSTDPQAMLAFLRDSGKLSDRKARLFAAACCRRIWHLTADERSRGAVRVTEQQADGCYSAEDAGLLAAAARATVAAEEHGLFFAAKAAEMVFRYDQGIAAAIEVCEFAALASSYAAPHDGVGDERRGQEERLAQGCILRDVVGNPFRPPPPVTPSVLRWNEGTVRRLAHAAYEERHLPSGHLEPDRLAVLADALEEAGCTDAEVLSHCRGLERCLKCGGRGDKAVKVVSTSRPGRQPLSDVVMPCFDCGGPWVPAPRGWARPGLLGGGPVDGQGVIHDRARVARLHRPRGDAAVRLE